MFGRHLCWANKTFKLCAFLFSIKLNDNTSKGGGLEEETIDLGIVRRLY